MRSVAVEYSVSDGVARVELNRPEAYNAVDVALADGLSLAMRDAGSDPSVRAVLLSGRGSAFCAGGDVKAMAAAEDPKAFVGDLAAASNRAVVAMQALEKPIVAAVQGSAAGAGLAYACAADLVVAAESARFLSAFTGVGLTPDSGASWFLPRLVGARRALELTLLNRVLSAAEALQWGLVTAVCADDALSEAAAGLALQLADGPTEALGRTRRLVLSSLDRSLAQHLEVEGTSIAAMAHTETSRRLLAAFRVR